MKAGRVPGLAVGYSAESVVAVVIPNDDRADHAESVMQRAEVRIGAGFGEGEGDLARHYEDRRRWDQRADVEVVDQFLADQEARVDLIARTRDGCPAVGEEAWRWWWWAAWRPWWDHYLLTKGDGMWCIDVLVEPGHALADVDLDCGRSKAEDAVGTEPLALAPRPAK